MPSLPAGHDRDVFDTFVYIEIRRVPIECRQSQTVRSIILSLCRQSIVTDRGGNVYLSKVSYVKSGIAYFTQVWLLNEENDPAFPGSVVIEGFSQASGGFYQASR